MHPTFQAWYGYQLVCAGHVNVPPCIIYIACVRDIFLYHSQISKPSTLTLESVTIQELHVTSGHWSLHVAMHV